MAKSQNTKSRGRKPDEIDLGTLSRKELEDLREEVKAAIDDFEERQKLMALKEVNSLLDGYGLTLADIVKIGPKGRVVQLVSEPKFANPDDPSQTWSGKGRRPAWFQAAIDKGVSSDDMRLPPS